METKVEEVFGKARQRGWKPRTLNWSDLASILSRTGHEKSCLNLGGPPSKAKYYLLTDSVLVPWGKGEKNPDKGSEIDFETMYLQNRSEEHRLNSSHGYISYAVFCLKKKKK